MHMKQKYALWLNTLATFAGCVNNPELPNNQRRDYHDKFQQAWFQDVPTYVREKAERLHGPLIAKMADIYIERRYNNLWGGYDK